jgi:hypothetical protein
MRVSLNGGLEYDARLIGDDPIATLPRSNLRGCRSTVCALGNSLRMVNSEFGLEEVY